MKVTACPVCGSSKAEKNLYKQFSVDSLLYEIVRCTHCHHYFTLFYSDVDIDKYYDEGDYTVRDTRRTIFHKVQEIEYNKVLKKVADLSVKKTLLDFGSGKGIFLSFAKEAGYAVAGVETSSPRAAFARKEFGVQVNSDLYTEGKIFDRSFSVITMFHVLEHIPEAGKLLGNLLADNLVSDGIAVVEVPNFYSWQSKWARNRWLHIDIPRHVSHFTDDSLKQLIDVAGFKVVRKETFSFHLGIIGMMQTIMDRLGYKGFLIGDLKAKRNIALLTGITLTFPFAFMLEWFSSLAGKGGVLRYYIKRK